jgi:ATP-binding cassette subfamily C protein
LWQKHIVKADAGLYFPESGNILIRIYNLQDLALDCVCKQVILIPQDAHFWSRSIIENFQLGNPEITFNEQIVKACQITEADDFISKLPDKYQTMLGEFGANLSGGQRQRLAIARAIVTDPPILILDESTAGLDPVSETQVLDNLLSQRKGKTTILISHRPMVINRADCVVLLEQGQLTLQGSMEELLSIPGSHCYFLKI